MLKPIHNPLKGKLRVLGYCSGSGSTLWKALELQKEMEKTFEGCPFEIVGMFSDNNESKAVEFAKRENIPYASIDIREFYKNEGAPLKDRNIRVKYDEAAFKLIQEFNADIILLAGYVWAVTDVILDNYLLVNVHPGDLSIMKDGQRVLAGHNGIQAAFNENMDYLCATSHLVNNNLDAGPILMISEKVNVDYTLHNDDKDRFSHYLRLVNDQSRLSGARTLLEIALGNFQIDNDGKVYYMNKLTPQGCRINNWNQNIPLYKRATEKLTSPKSIAVIGASNKPGIGYAIVKNLVDINFPGPLYAVNTRGENVLSANGVTSVLDIPEEIDMGVIAVPSHAVLSIAEECGKKGIKVLICISAGFSEIGDEGKKKEDQLIEIVNRYNMRMIGPNCMGIANTDDNVRLSSTILSDVPPKGNIAFITQSGSMGASIIDFAKQLGIGFSVITSLGNQADIDVCDLLNYLEEDKNTKVILLYLESIKNPSRFLSNIHKVTKPVVVLKSGRSLVGAKAASSHTGSLASNDNITEAYLKKSNVIRVETLEDAFLLASTLSKTDLLKGNRIGIVTNAGGPGILFADALTKYGFEIPPLSDELKDKLRPMLLPEGAVNNPIDVVAPAPPIHYVYAVTTMLESNQFDGLIINCVPPATVDTGAVAKAIMPLLKSSPIPVLSCFIGPTLGLAGKKVMLTEGIQEFDFPEQLVKIMSYMRKSKEKEIEEVIITIPSENIKASNKLISSSKNGSYMNVEDCITLLDNYGIPMAKSGYIKEIYDISKLTLNYPIVAKIDHNDIIHKSDVGGVKLNICNEDELKLTFNEWQNKFVGLNGVFVQEQINKGIELIIGCAFDNVLGHSIIVGLGGTLVEILKDVSFGHVPLSTKDILRMIDSLKTKELLTGYRGESGVNLDELIKILKRISHMLINHPEIEALDINPLIFNKEKDSFIGVDCRIKIRE